MSNSRVTHSASSASGVARLVVPDSLKQQLTRFRDRVWFTKIVEAILLGSLGVLLAFLTVYVCDRFFDTPREARLGIFVFALGLWLVVPWAVHRWVWKNRRLDQLARLLRVREPGVGDQLLSVIELAGNDSEQARSRTLCAAAITQVAESAKGRDFTRAAPPTRLRSLGVLLLASGVASLLLAVLFPAAASNAWARLATPWRNTPRYTFTSVEPLPSTLVVPHGEPTPLVVRLTSQTQWHPAAAQLQTEHLPPLESQLGKEAYRFELPPQTSPTSFTLRVGDYAQVIQIEPRLRPELVEAVATVQLPAYLERVEPYQQDVRSGILSVVEGSRATLHATASRELQSANINDQAAPIEQASFASQPLEVSAEPQSLHIDWADHAGLAGREPFKLTIKSVVDELPSVVSQDLPRQAVVLDSEQINFQALAADDFGIKRIGISWQGIDEQGLVVPAVGEKLLSAGGPTNTSMQVPATFSASSLGISAQPLEVRLWTEDYLPGRERVYTPPHILFVLTPEEHAVWIASQMSKWHRAALDVRDKEMQLHEANKRLRAMTPEELADEEMRQELRRQASLESANARRLSALTASGEDLLRQAARNSEIGVGHLDRWAEMLQILNDIGANRMPSVSDLLDKASTEKQLARGASKPAGPKAGVTRSSTPGKGQPQEEEATAANKPKMPSISDSESSVQPMEEADEQQASKKKKKGGSRLTLPKTTLAGPPPKAGAEEEEPEEEEEEASVDQALHEQADLLAEFERIADELNTILANLEGSTLVKRLKAASREQNQVAEKIGSRIDAVFGAASKPAEDRDMLRDLTQVEEKSSENISYIMDDMQAYFERRRMNQFKVVLDDMKESNVLDALRTLGEEIPTEQGMSIAQAEYWSDTLDRWGEDLVDPACSGQCPGCKTSDALPPSLILEVLKILESEVNLREATRVAEQARAGVESAAHNQEAQRLSSSQNELEDRTEAVVTAIQALPDGASRFAKEVNLLGQVAVVMSEAEQILASSDTGSLAIAAETEAIELLLQCKRINPKAGGGGGSDPGGGGSGTTQDSALALLGSGLNQNERREAREVSQATGETGRTLPEEFRGGLDAYFNRLEQGL